MFTSYKVLKRKSPSPGINREEFIEHLIEEYYTTTNLEAQEQVTANLANFAYDPLNWNYLKKSQAVKLFLELLEIPNETLQLHGTAGLCNISLDKDIFSYIRKPEVFKIIQKLFVTTRNEEIIINICTLIYQLLANDNNRKSLPVEILQRTHHINTLNKSNQRLFKVTSLLLLDFGRRYEIFERPSK